MPSMPVEYEAWPLPGKAFMSVPGGLWEFLLAHSALATLSVGS